jgi:hypothetical protein
MGRLAVGLRRKDSKWYRLSSPLYRCPTCRAVVDPKARIVTYALQGALVAVFSGELLFLMANHGMSDLAVYCMMAGDAVLGALVSVACIRWGFEYRLGTEDR